MKNFNAQLNPEDYDELLKEFVENPTDDVINQYERYHLQFNINYYPFLLAAIERAKEALVAEGKPAVTLDELKQKFEQLNNVYPPGNLPNSIINDRELRRLLGDKGAMSKSEIWESWENYVQRMVDNTPRATHLPFYEWCVGQLKLNLKRHRVICERPDDCETEKGYERRFQFFERKIEDASITVSESALNEGDKPLLKKMQWLGTQKELGELFVELQKKGWIADFEYETIKQAFSKSNTIQQVMKPAYDEAYIPAYDGIYTSEYEPKFFGIKENPKKGD